MPAETAPDERRGRVTPADLTRASGLLTPLALLSALFGFWLQLFLASRFGASAASDAYFAAAAIPALLTTVVLMAISIASVPLLVDEAIRHGPGSSRRAGVRISSFLGLVTAVGCLALWLAAVPIMALAAPGLLDHEPTFELAVSVNRILLFSVPLASLSGGLAAVFLSRKILWVPTAGQIVSHATALLVALLAAPRVGVAGVALGVVTGAMAQLLFLLQRLSTLPSPEPAPRTKVRIGPVVRSMAPWVAGALVYKAHPVIERFFASRMETGTVAVLGFAFMLVQLGVLLSSKAISVAVFPVLSESAATRSFDDLRSTVDLGIRSVVVVLLPVLLIFAFLNDDIVRVLFQHGAFSPADSARSAEAVIAFLGALAALAVGSVVNSAHYSLRDTTTPALIWAAGIGAYVPITLLLLDPLGYLAPAIAYSLSSMLSLVGSSFMLRRRIGGLVLASFSGFLRKAALAGAPATVALLACDSLLPQSSALTFAGALGRLTACSTVSLAAYAITWSRMAPGTLSSLFRRKVASAPLPISEEI